MDRAIMHQARSSWLLPEGQEGRRMRPVLLLVPRFFAYKAGNGVAEAGVSDPVQAPGWHRLEAALDLVFTLRTGVEAPEAMADTVVDALVVAGFEVQELVVGRCTPVAPVECV